MSEKRQEILATAVAIARDAGEILREGFNQGKEIARKSSTVDLVTQYDGLCEELITGRLREHFPDHRLVGEEGTDGGGPEGSPFVWYIDPLDGTVNFAHGYPIYSVSMALFENDRPLLGVVYDPERDECFSAISGRGAFLQRGERPPLRLQVSGETDLGRSLLGTGFPYDRQHSELDNAVQLRAFLKTCRGVRRSGSAALDLCNVAAGRLDGFWEYKLKIWDVAAAVLFIEEAGGKVSHTDGRRPFVPERVIHLIASTPGIHEQMAAVLDQVERAAGG